MTKGRQIEIFISRSIKKGTTFESETELLTLLNSMTTTEISIFWAHYSASKAFREANINVPDWKTKQQTNYFLERSNLYMFYPKEKDSNGQYIIDRKELITHVVGHITSIIDDEIKSKSIFKNKSFLEKMPAYILIFTFLTVPLFMICSIFSFNVICKNIADTCGLLYFINSLLYVLISVIIKYRRKRIIQ